MLNVRAEQIAFMRNTSDGFASVANGLEWEKGDNIVSFATRISGKFLCVAAKFAMLSASSCGFARNANGRIDLDEFFALDR